MIDTMRAERLYRGDAVTVRDLHNGLSISGVVTRVSEHGWRATINTEHGAMDVDLIWDGAMIVTKDGGS